MASSARCNAGSSGSAATNECQDVEVFSDDSGVDLRPQAKNVDIMGALNLCMPDSRRNKRKSSEPKRRKDVLQMKRFRWDTDDDDDVHSGSDIEDTFDEGERPSSGDSGCQVELLPETPRKKRPKKGSKPCATEHSPLDFAKPTIPLTPRQSVIKKREDTSAIAIPSTNSIDSKDEVHQDLLMDYTSPVTSNSVDVSVLTPEEYDLTGESSSAETSRTGGRPRNYKSMSRQRRIEANARERTRVHTISAAFESLRRAVPAYAHNQKLSKLAILRIASAYIVALACLNDQDYSQEQDQPSLSDCVEQCTRTIQAEGKSRRRTKD